MTNEPAQEQITAFWEWCGFKYKETKWLDEAHTRFEQEGWVYPDGTMGSSPETLFHLPPIDLNNLFKYAVPKLLEMERSVSVTVDVARSGAIVRDKFDKTLAIWKETHRDNPALALFWAIREVIKETATNQSCVHL